MLLADYGIALRTPTLSNLEKASTLIGGGLGVLLFLFLQKRIIMEEKIIKLKKPNYCIYVYQIIIGHGECHLMTMNLNEGISKEEATKTVRNFLKAICETGRLYITNDINPDGPHGVVIDVTGGPIKMKLEERKD